MTGDKPNLTILGKLMILAIVGGSLYGAYVLLANGGSIGSLFGRGQPEAAESRAGDAGGEQVSTTRRSRAGVQTSFGIAYGTEKERWLEWALTEFQKTEAGQRVDVQLIPMGSLEGAQAVLKGDERIHVWSPASALYRDVFVQEWQFKYGKHPLAREEALALSPMVFVVWKERYDAFVQKYGTVTFRSIKQGLEDPTGWSGIAGRPEWGVLKFGHTHPNQSNSGLMALVLEAYDFHGKSRELALADILDPAFQGWLQALEGAVSGLSASTGTMMREMVLKGPSAYDVLFVYESVVIDYLKNAQGRWGDLQVVYPERNMWNDNPYMILDAPWSSAEQRAAAGTFLDFLLSEPIQAQALVHGFRPGNPAVPIKTPESPFTLFAKHGLSVDLPSVCEPPSAEVINNLLASWQRGPGSRR